LAQDILVLLDELRSIAQLGLNYSDNPYDRERYERLLRLAAGQYSAVSSVSEDEIITYLRSELGYITPKVGCNGAVFNDQGHVLLVQRSDNGRWGLPGGYAEVNLTPQENCRRELLEETGLEVEVGALVDVFSVLPGEYDQPNTNYLLVYLCSVVGGQLTPSHETPIVGFYDHTAITNWHSNHQYRIERAYQQWQASKVK
jgi:ADP-ribose pyrophosphatase YjhB (NUDIX family)